MIWGKFIQKVVACAITKHTTQTHKKIAELYYFERYREKEYGNESNILKSSSHKYYWFTRPATFNHFYPNYEWKNDPQKETGSQKSYPMAGRDSFAF